MKLRDIITEGPVGNFVSSFKQGLAKTGPVKGSIRQQFKKSNPYDIIRPEDMKIIIDLVLNKKPLAPEQEVLLRKLHKRL